MVLDVDGGDPNAAGVDEHVIFDAIDVLCRFEAARPGHRGRLDVGGINDGRGGSSAAAGAGADFAADRGKDSRPCAVAAPAQEVFVRGRSRHGEVVRQMPPWPPGALHIQDGVEVFAPPPGWTRPPAVGMFRNDEAGDARPRGVGQIEAVPSPPLTGFRVTGLPIVDHRCRHVSALASVFVSPL